MVGRRITSRAFTFGVGAVVAGAIAWGLQPKRVPADCRDVRRGTLEVRVRDDGVTRIRERYMIAAPLGGTMRRVALHVGDAVEAGETIVTVIEPTDPALLDPRAEAEAKARRDAALAALAFTEELIQRGRVAVEYTAADLERAKELAPSGAVTHEQLDAAERAWRTAVEELHEAEQESRVADHLVALMEAALLRSSRSPSDTAAVSDWRMELRAPAAGVVLRVIRENAGPVAAGGEIVEVGDPTNLEAVIDLVSEDAVRVKRGDRGEITGWGGDHPLAASVRVVEPRGFTKVSPLGVEEQRVNVVLAIDAPPAARRALGDDFRVEAAITVDEVHDAVLVPLAALFRSGDHEAVFVVDAGRARHVAVRTGRRGEREAEVLEGLDGHERVVVYPADAIVDGTRLMVSAANTP